MKIVVLLALLIIAILLFLAFSGGKTQQQEEENKKCLTPDNFILIRDSPLSDQLSEYAIHRMDNELKFTRQGKGYTLFYLKWDKEISSVKLIGLDGYGVRDREFLKYICDLIKKIKEQ